MKWLKDNLFLVVLGAVTLVGVVAFGVLISSAKSSLDEVNQKYTTKAAEAVRLQGGKPYPSATNLKSLEEQKTAYQEQVELLLAALATYNTPMETIAPNEFQARLRDTVNRVQDAAKRANVTLPENFYFDLNQYETSFARNEAAPVLGRWLSSAEQLVNLLIANRIDTLEFIKRWPVVEENPAHATTTGGGSGKPQAKPTPSPKKINPGGKPATAEQTAKDATEAILAARRLESALLTRYPIEIAFTADQSVAQSVLNGIVEQKTFFTISAVEIFNEKRVGPSRGSEIEAPPSVVEESTEETPLASEVEDTNSNATALEYVLGREKVRVVLRLDMIVFSTDADVLDEKSNKQVSP